MKRYVGIDYGEKRVGIALADDDAWLAVPHRIFEFNTTYDEDMEHLSIIIKGEADAIVLGLPLTMNGEEGPMVEKVREFARDLMFRTDLPVHFQDERCTTRENAGLLQGMPTEEKRVMKDALAAASILQTWIDRNKRKNIL